MNSLRRAAQAAKCESRASHATEFSEMPHFKDSVRLGS